MRTKATTTRTTVAATPGWYLVTPTHDAAGLPDALYYTEVVAWVVESTVDDGEVTYTMSYPCAVEGQSFRLDRWAIKTPAGEYIRPEVCSYDSEAALIADFRAEAEKMRAAQMARAPRKPSLHEKWLASSDHASEGRAL